MCGAAPAQIPCAKISVCRGVRGMFAASGTIIMSNDELTSLGYRRKWNRISPRLGSLAQSISELESTIMLQDRRTRESAPKYFETLHRERSAVYGKLLGIEDLRTLLQSQNVPDELRSRLPSLLDRIDHLRASTSCTPLYSPASA